jgi:hypothetical protein
MNISSYPEHELMKIASGFKKHLKNSFPTIKGVYSELDQGFIYKFKALFYEVQANPREPEVDQITTKYKLELEGLADEVRNFFVIFRFYLQKAFPYDSALCQSYGYIEVEKITHDFAGLRVFLKNTVKLIHEKKSVLNAVKCPDPILEEIISLERQIAEVHDELLKYIQKKESRNKSYQNNLRELFKLMEIVHEAASKSLQNDPESLRHLTFPPKKGYIH